MKTELNKCYRGEGVNAKQFCKELAERYVNMLRDNQVSIESGSLACWGLRKGHKNIQGGRRRLQGPVLQDEADTQIKGFTVIDKE